MQTEWEYQNTKTHQNIEILIQDNSHKVNTQGFSFSLGRHLLFNLVRDGG